MLAAFHDEVGSPGVLQYGEIDAPALGDHDVLVQMAATSIDRLDIYRREGSHGLVSTGRQVGGRDVAGTVVAVGPRVTGVALGEDVVALARDARGAHAEQVACRDLLTFPIPAGCSTERAAAIPTAGRSAWAALVELAQIRPGEWVLVFAAGSGVGSFGVQIARAAGCFVIGTAGSEWKCARALEIGAHAAINHYTADIEARVAEITDGRGVDVVLDHVGTPVWDAAMASLAPGGRFVTTGVTAGHRVSLHLGQVFTKGLTIAGIGRPDDAQIRRHLSGLLELVAQGAVTPIVDRVFPLADVAAAHAHVESGEFFGKVVLVR
jgi:NADPH:quinone reductase